MPRSTNARITADAGIKGRLLSRKDAQIRNLKKRIGVYEGIGRSLTAERDEARLNFSNANDLIGEQASALENCGHQTRIMRAQIDALDAHLDALAQRYAGVKLDCQQFTFPAAQEWLKSERSAVSFKLNQVRREYDDARENGEGQVMSRVQSRVG